MTDTLWCVVNGRGEAMSKPLPRITAEHMLSEIEWAAPGHKTQCTIVAAEFAIQEQRLVRDLTEEQALATGTFPECFKPRDGVRFELHTILPT